MMTYYFKLCIKFLSIDNLANFFPLTLIIYLRYFNVKISQGKVVICEKIPQRYVYEHDGNRKVEDHWCRSLETPDPGVSNDTWIR